jgi:hypothetical protein
MTLGDKFYYLLAGPIIIFSVKQIAKKCKPRFLRCSPCRKLYAYFKALDEGLRWNGVIGFFASNYLLLVAAVMIQFLDPKFGLDFFWQEQFSNYFNMIFAIFLFGFPFFILRLYEVQL